MAGNPVAAYIQYAVQEHFHARTGIGQLFGRRHEESNKSIFKAGHIRSQGMCTKNQ